MSENNYGSVVMEDFVLKNGQRVVIRDLEPKDYDSFCNFFQKLALETIFTNQYPNRPKQTKENFLRRFENKAMFALGVFDNRDKMVGLCNVYIERPEHPWLNRSCEFGIMILKQYTSGGLGTYLMKKMEEWARRENMHRMMARVRAKNVAALSLYLKCGFVVEGLAREVAFINDEWHDEYLIAKIL